MSYVDDFIKAENELRARQEAAVQAQLEREASMHMTGKALLRFFGIIVIAAIVVAFILFQSDIFQWAKDSLR